MGSWRHSSSIYLLVTLALLPILGGIGCQGRSTRDSAGDHKLILRAYGHLESDQVDLARATFEQATNGMHNAAVRGEAYLGLARCELQESDHEGAVAYLERARTLLVGSPSTATVELLLAESSLYLGAYERARIHLEGAYPYLAAGPARQRCAYLLALLHERTGSPQAASYRSVVGSREFPEYAEWRDLISPPVVEPEVTVKRPPIHRVEPKAHFGEVTIRKRSSWGARKTRRNVAKMGKVKRITIHHTGEASLPKFANRADVASYLRRLQRSHQQHRRWADLGYHYLIDRFGNVWEGRSIRYQGAHAGSPKTNEGNIGVSLIGNFDVGRPSKKQIGALTQLLSQLRHEYRVGSQRIYTHQKLKQSAGLDYTDCPGKFVMQIFPKLVAQTTGPEDSPAARKAWAQQEAAIRASQKFAGLNTCPCCDRKSGASRLVRASR